MFSIHMEFSQKAKMAPGNLNKAHREGAFDGPAKPAHPPLTIKNRANVINRLWWRYLEPKREAGRVSCQTTDQLFCRLESMADIRLQAARRGSPNHQQ